MLGRLLLLLPLMPGLEGWLNDRGGLAAARTRRYTSGDVAYIVVCRGRYIVILSWYNDAYA